MENGKGQTLVRLGTTVSGGAVQTLNAKGQTLVELGTTDAGGSVATLNGKGQKLVELGAREDGPGAVWTYDPRSIEARAVYTTTR